MTNEKINEQVALKLGWEKMSTGKWKEYAMKGLFVRETKSVSDYSGSIAAAWEIPTLKPTCGELNFQLRFYFSCYKNSVGFGSIWWAGWTSSHPRGGDSEDTISAEASTAPLAICLAFLKLP